MRGLAKQIGRALAVLGMMGLATGRAEAASLSVSQTNLVTDNQSVNHAAITDPNLVNPWGVSFSATSPFWVSDNGTGVATLYSVNAATGIPTQSGLVVTIPPAGAGTPTGQVFNAAGGGAFNGNNFLFVSEDGTVSGWRGAVGTTAEILALSSASNVYKGVTEDIVGGNAYLLSANFRSGNIDVFKGSAGAPDLPGKFTDPGIPNGYAPFNIQFLGGKVYVTYALQDSAKHDDVPGLGNGFVSVFDASGNFLNRLASHGNLDSPWGLAIAPTSFGSLAGDLLVGNFGNGWINAYNLTTNTFDGQLTTPDGQPLAIDGLWALTVGNGSTGSLQTLYFTAGPDDESHGLFGALTVVPEPSSIISASTAFLMVLGVAWRSRSAKASAVRVHGGNRAWSSPGDLTY